MLILDTSNNYFGAEVSLLVLLRALRPNSFDLVIQNEPGDFEERLQLEGIPYRKTQMTLSPRRKGFLGTVKALDKLISTRGHTIVYANNDDGSMLLAALKLRRFMTIKTFVHMRMKPGNGDYLRRLMFLHNGVIANSKFVAGALAAAIPWTPANIRVIYNSHARRGVLPPSRGRKGPKVLLSLGRLSPQKSQLEVLKALVQNGVMEEIDTYYLVGAGKAADPGYQKEIEAYIEEKGLGQKVVLVPFTHDPDPYYARATLVIVAGVGESFGRVIIEAGFWRIPAIVRNSGALPELVEHGYTGLVWDGSPSQLALHVRAVCSDERYAELLGNRLHEEVMLKYSDERYVSSLMRCFGEEG